MQNKIGKNNSDISLEKYEEILNISLENKNLNCLIFDKEIMNKEKALKIAGKYKMEISKNETNSKI